MTAYHDEDENLSVAGVPEAVVRGPDDVKAARNEWVIAQNPPQIERWALKWADALLDDLDRKTVGEVVAWRIEDLILPGVRFTEDAGHAARCRDAYYEGEPTAKVTPLYAAPSPAIGREREAEAELAKIAETLGCKDDPYAAWETLEVVLTALRFYASPNTYAELSEEDADRLGIPGAGMVHRPGLFKVSASAEGRCVPAILVDWGKRAKAALRSQP